MRTSPAPYRKIAAHFALAAAVVLALAFGVLNAAAQSGRDATLAPRTNHGKPFKIGYLETRPFVNYAATLANLVDALKDTGWLKTTETVPYQPQQTDARVIWNWLSAQKNEPFVEFVKDGFYTYDGLQGAEVKAASAKLIDRLKTKSDIDLMLVMGTDAGVALAVDDHQTPAIVMSTSNAVEAGIVKSAGYSKRDHVWAHMDPLRYRRQIDIFYDVFRFKKLGVVYDDDLAGRTFAAIQDLEAAAAVKGFEIVREYVKQPQKYGERKEAFYRDLEAAHARLAASSDAVYFGLFIGIDAKRLPAIFAPLSKSGIPVFAQQATDVRDGALLSLARVDFKGVGRFNAEAMARALNGVPLSKIPQIYENSPNIIMNLEVATRIGFRPRFELLLVADELIAKIR